MDKPWWMTHTKRKVTSRAPDFFLLVCIVVHRRVVVIVEAEALFFSLDVLVISVDWIDAQRCMYALCPSAAVGVVVILFPPLHRNSASIA